MMGPPTMPWCCAGEPASAARSMTTVVPVVPFVYSRVLPPKPLLKMKRFSLTYARAETFVDPIELFAEGAGI